MPWRAFRPEHPGTVLQRTAHLMWGLIPNVYAGIIAFAALLAAFAVMLAAYQYVVYSRDPVTEDAIVSMDPADGYIERQDYRASYLTLVRRVCSSRTAQVEVVRNWAEYHDSTRDAPPKPPGAISERSVAEAVVVFSTQTTTIREGCHNYSVQQYIPENLRPRVYTYEATLKFPATAFSTPTHKLQEAYVSIAGGGVWEKPQGRPPPPPPTPTTTRSAEPAR